MTARCRSADGVEIAVHDLGGSGEVALLAHATGFCGRVLSPMAEALADRFHCYALDLRGHGLSGVPEDGDFAWAGFARDILAAARHLEGLGEPIALGFGHSAGGAAVLMAALDEPGLFPDLYCYEPVVLPPELRNRKSGRLAQRIEGARRRRAVFASRQAVLERYRSAPGLAGVTDAALAAYVEHGFADLPDGSVRLRCEPENEARVFLAAHGCDVYERLEGIDAPVTLAFGEETSEFERSSVTRAVEQIPAGSLVELSSVGHLGPLQDPAAVAASIKAHVAAGR